MSLDNTVNLLCNLATNNFVAFDFDGTLVNCEIRQVQVLRSILRRKEINLIDFDYEKWWTFKINGSNTLDALIKMQIDTNKAKKINNAWIEIIENPEWLDLDKLRENVYLLLKELIKLNKSIYIITARKSRYFFLNQIKKLTIDLYISKAFVVNPSNGKEEKKELLSSLKPAYFVGDSENDYFSAMNAGINFIAITSGQRSKKFLLANGINQFIDNFYI